MFYSKNLKIRLFEKASRRLFNFQKNFVNGDHINAYFDPELKIL